MQLCSGQNALPTVQCCSAKKAHSRQCFIAVTPVEIRSSYRCAVTQHKCSAALFRAKCVQCCSAKQAHSRQCFIAVTVMEICCTSGCAMTQHKCSAALFRAKCTPHCSVLLCNEGSQQAVFHCSYTYGDVLFIQVCSDPAQMQCSSVQGKMHSPLFSAALQRRLTAGSVSLQLHLWRFALHTGVQ